MLDVLISTRVTMGPKVRAFEQMYAERYGYKEAVMVNSGSSANLLAIAAIVTCGNHQAIDEAARARHRVTQDLHGHAGLIIAP